MESSSESMSDDEGSSESEDFKNYNRKLQESEQTNNTNDREIYTKRGHTDSSMRYGNY